MREIEFAKLHALGNDFLILKVGDDRGVQQALASVARQICARHTGVGADGILCYHTTLGDAEADFSALIFNADGSRAEISGNGLRCLAAFVHNVGLSSSPVIRVRTVAGVRVLRILEEKGKSYKIESSMGSPITDPSRLGLNLESGTEPLVGWPLRIETEEISVTICSMGNPHCSTYWPDVTQAPIERIGPLLETHEGFPRRTNVEFIQVINRNRLRVRFWERGVGSTLASGTGSSAAVVASILHGYVESPVTVETAEGMCLVKWSPPDELFLTGLAEFICSGVYVDASI
jgi:diaminopimelate epimerase